MILYDIIFLITQSAYIRNQMLALSEFTGQQMLDAIEESVQRGVGFSQSDTSDCCDVMPHIQLLV